MSIGDVTLREVLILEACDGEADALRGRIAELEAALLKALIMLRDGKPLGGEFAAIWDANAATLYEK